MNEPRDRRPDPRRGGKEPSAVSLQEDLAALQTAWESGEGAEPAQELDLAVLRTAREAVAGESPRAWRAWPWTRGWAHNLATVAVVAIAVTLLLQLDLQQDTAPAAVEAEDRRADERASPARQRFEADSVTNSRARDEPLEESARVPDPELLRRLEELQTLREAGDQEAYERALAAFQADYPDHPLPEQLPP